MAITPFARGTSKQLPLSQFGPWGIHVLVDMIAVHVVEMAIVKVIDVPVVHDRGVPATRTMLMRVSLVNFAAHKDDLSIGHFVHSTRRLPPFFWKPAIACPSKPASA
ncbi:MAG TPA: hypothetical protein VGM54_20120 [Chthoniobacter sp.]